MPQNRNFLYLRLYSELKQAIDSGRLRPGQRIAPEHELMRQYAVSRDTVRRALAKLENEGYLHSEDYGRRLLSLFDRCRRELPIGYAVFHLPWVAEWYTAARQYRAAYELLRDFPVKVPLPL